jgi:hypothetical protein
MSQFDAEAAIGVSFGNTLEEESTMIDRMRVCDGAACELVRPLAGSFDPVDQRVKERLNPRGRYVVEHWRGGRKIGQYEIANLITNEGKNKLLDVQFHAVTQITAWYLGLINASPAPSLAAGDTYAQIGGTNDWTEWDDYDEATRGEWTEGAASSQTITNASPVVFTISAGGDVYGLFLVGGGTAPQTKNDSAGGGTLWGEAAFASGTVSVLDNDQLKVTYTVSA